jgi:pimeloyl-ACP methyl ester carboxylesterase
MYEMRGGKSMKLLGRIVSLLFLLPGPAGAGELSLTPYVLESDDGRSRIPAELGRLLVPENRNDPKSRRIELAFVRLRGATSPGTPLILLAGGPGASGITMGRRAPLLAFAEKARELGDVILLDQRSTGLSLPKLDCPGRLELPLDREMTAESMLFATRELSRRCAAFWKEHGADLRGYTTAESADDVDAVREALGAPKMNLYGASYGSHLALATIKRHGDKVQRAIIPMVEGPDHTIKLPSNVQRQLETIHERAKADPNVSAGMPDFLGTVREVLECLGKQPATVEVEDPVDRKRTRITVGKFDLQKVTANGLGDIRFLRALPARYKAMAGGDYTWLGQEALRIRMGAVPASAMSFHMDCASGLSEARRERIRKEAPQTLLGDVIDFPWPAVCDAWGNPDLGPEFRANPRSGVPVLFMSGTIDGRTPASNALEVKAGFPDSWHILVDGMGHGHPQLFPQLGGVMLDFLKGKPVTMTEASLPFAFEPVR